MDRTWPEPSKKAQAIANKAVKASLQALADGDIDLADRELIHAVHDGVRPLDLILEATIQMERKR